MKTFWAVLLLMGCAVAGVRGGPEGATVPAAEAVRHVEERVQLEGLVSEVHQSRKGHLFLNFGGVWPDQVCSIYIPPSAHLDHAELKRLLGKVVTVTGTIRLYQGKPEIVVTRREQIQPGPKE